MTASARRIHALLGAALLFCVLVVPMTVAAAAGGSDAPQATASAGVKKQIKRLKQQLAELQQKVDTLQQQPGPQGPEGPPGPATGPTGEENVTRSVNLPLASFHNVSAGTIIDFSSGADNSPDFATNGAAATLVADDDPGSQDLNDVASTLTVPQDAVAGGTGSIALRVSKEADGGVADQLFGRLSVNGAGPVLCSTETTTGTENTSYLLTCPSALSPGDSVAVDIAASPIDDTIHIHSVEFRYTAVQ
jgi:hypothetical protein